MDLNDLFILVSQEKKKQKEELKELVSDSFDNLIWNQLNEEVKPPTKRKNKSRPKLLKPENSLGLFSEPANVKQNNDPLTPLDQNFVTFDELQKHYKLFLKRIQHQLSTLGGGGEVNLAYMTLPAKTVMSPSYSVTYRDYYVGVDYAGAVEITLPKADREGRVYIIKDEKGEASKGNNRHIIIYPHSGSSIDGKSRAIIAYDYGSLTFIWKNNSWRIV